MADNTKIEWADATVNAINGCSVHSPGCTNCYAMKLAGGRLKHVPSRAGLTAPSKAGPVWTGEVRLDEKALLQPLRWKRPRRIFWNAHGDIFHDAVPDEWIDRIFAVCALTPQHQHLILTKRSARMRKYVSCLPNRDDLVGQQSLLVGAFPSDADKVMRAVRMPLPNVWLGVSVEDQPRADERIPDLLATPAAVRFLSCEPLLGPVDLQYCSSPYDYHQGWPGTYAPLIGSWWPAVGNFEEEYRNREEGLSRIDWVIVGGESGPGVRPMHPDWARSLRDQCQNAGVPFFFKQWGEWAPCEIDGKGGLNPPVSMRKMAKWLRWEGSTARPANCGETVQSFMAPGVIAIPSGKKAAGRLIDGREWNEVPR